MLVICNGAFKSGSSWIHALVNSIMHLRAVVLTPVPKEYNAGKSPVSLISEHLLPSFVATEDIRSNNYLTKAHFFSERTLSRNYSDDVIFIFIERDLRDAVVSHYHHFKAMIRQPISFAWYYWLVGRYKAYEITLFNSRCRRHFGDRNFFGYEQMKSDPADALRRLCAILRVKSLTAEEFASVMQETSIESMRNNARVGNLIYYHDAGNSHAEMFRKGAIGEYQDYFGARALRDVDAIARLKFSAFDRTIYKWLFTYRRALR